EDSGVVQTNEGNVTVVKLKNTQSTESQLVFHIDAAGAVTDTSSDVTVALPRGLVDELQTQANVIMTVTQVVEEASAGIPNENAQRDKLIFNNRVLEFSLIKERARELSMG
ncbi:unnamed protein product, partial [Effrenium voratum]